MNESKLFEKEEFIAPFHIPQDLESQAQAVAEISGKLASILDFGELIEETVRLIQQTLKYDQVILYLTDPFHGQLALKVLASANHDQIIRSDFLEDELSLARFAAQENRLIRIHDLESETPKYYQAEAGFRSELHIPLERNSSVVGVLSLRSRKRKVFEDYHIFALKILASQIALLIERTGKDQWGSLVQADGQLPETTQHSPEVDFQAILPNIQDLAGIRETFQEIVNRLVSELGYPGAMVAVIDETGQNLSLQAMAFDSSINMNLLQKVEKTLGFGVIGAYQSLLYDKEGLGVKACLSGQIQFSNNLYDLFRPVVNRRLCDILQKASGIKTCISIPLILKGRAVGSLYATTRSNQISNDDRQKLQLFADSVAIAIKFEQLNEGLVQQVLQLTQLRSIERAINHSLQDIEKVLERILMGALELTRAPYGHLVLVGKYAAYLIDRVSYPRSAAFDGDRPGITQWIIRDRKPIQVDDIEKVRQTDESIRNLIPGIQN